MITEPINLKLAPLPYQKRRKSLFRLTLLLYAFFGVICMFASDLNTLFILIPFIAILFMLDYSRRLAWVKYVIESLESDQSGIKLAYCEKHNLLSEVITWDMLTISKGIAFTRSPTRLITIKNGSNKIASFYGDRDAGIDNDKLIELYEKLKALKAAYDKTDRSNSHS